MLKRHCKPARLCSAFAQRRQRATLCSCSTSDCKPVEQIAFNRHFGQNTVMLKCKVALKLTSIVLAIIGVASINCALVQVSSAQLLQTTNHDNAAAAPAAPTSSANSTVPPQPPPPQTGRLATNQTANSASLNSSGAIGGPTSEHEHNQVGLAELNPDASDTVPLYMQRMTTVLVSLHLSVFVTGLVGNSLVCLSVYRNKSLQTITNYYIVNLAVADFLVILICLPPTVYWDLTLTWNFGLVLCKLVPYLQSTSVSVSVLTLTCISIDRWYAICRPLKFCSTKSRVKKTIALIWLVSGLIASPDVIFLTTRPLYEENGYVYTDCIHSWPETSTKIYQLCIVTLLFVLPFILMIVSYSQIVNVLWRNETMAECMQNSFTANTQKAATVVQQQQQQQTQKASNNNDDDDDEDDDDDARVDNCNGEQRVAGSGVKELACNKRRKWPIKWTNTPNGSTKSADWSESECALNGKMDGEPGGRRQRGELMRLTAMAWAAARVLRSLASRDKRKQIERSAGSNCGANNNNNNNNKTNWPDKWQPVDSGERQASVSYRCSLRLTCKLDDDNDHCGLASGFGDRLKASGQSSATNWHERGTGCLEMDDYCGQIELGAARSEAEGSITGSGRGAVNGQMSSNELQKRQREPKQKRTDCQPAARCCTLKLAQIDENNKREIATTLDVGKSAISRQQQAGRLGSLTAHQAATHQGRQLHQRQQQRRRRQQQQQRQRHQRPPPAQELQAQGQHQLCEHSSGQTVVACNEDQAHLGRIANNRRRGRNLSRGSQERPVPASARDIGAPLGDDKIVQERKRLAASGELHLLVAGLPMKRQERHNHHNRGQCRHLRHQRHQHCNRGPNSCSSEALTCVQRRGSPGNIMRPLGEHNLIDCTREATDAPPDTGIWLDNYRASGARVNGLGANLGLGASREGRAANCPPPSGSPCKVSILMRAHDDSNQIGDDKIRVNKMADKRQQQQQQQQQQQAVDTGNERKDDIVHGIKRASCCKSGFSLERMPPLPLPLPVTTVAKCEPVAATRSNHCEQQQQWLRWGRPLSSKTGHLGLGPRCQDSSVWHATGARRGLLLGRLVAIKVLKSQPKPGEQTVMGASGPISVSGGGGGGCEPAAPPLAESIKCTNGLMGASKRLVSINSLATSDSNSNSNSNSNNNDNNSNNRTNATPSDSYVSAKSGLLRATTTGGGGGELGTNCATWPPRSSESLHQTGRDELAQVSRLEQLARPGFKRPTQAPVQCALMHQIGNCWPVTKRRPLKRSSVPGASNICPISARIRCTTTAGNCAPVEGDDDDGDDGNDGDDGDDDGDDAIATIAARVKAKSTGLARAGLSDGGDCGGKLEARAAAAAAQSHPPRRLGSAVQAAGRRQSASSSQAVAPPPQPPPAASNINKRFCKLIESRKKAAKMLIVIVIMFGLCYLPVHFLNTLRCTIGLPQNDITTIASLVSHWLCYFNSAVNPLIYNLMSGKFRHEFANLFFCRCFRRSANGATQPQAQPQTQLLAQPLPSIVVVASTNIVS